MFHVNENYQKLPGSYLFSTIAKKVNAYQEANPDKNIIRLGIGDVTQPLAPAIIEAMHKAVDEMGHAETFHGYAPDLGYEFCARQSQRTIMQQEAVRLQQMKFLCLTEQRAIPEIFRRFSDRITRLRSVIRYTRFMWIPTLWLEEPVLTTRRPAHGAMSFTCHVQQKIISYRSFLRRHRT